VGKAVTGIINNLVATKNRALFVRETDVAQKYLLQLGGKAVDVVHVSTAELEKKARQELEKSEPNMSFFVVSFLKQATFGQGYGSLFPNEVLSNDLLGIRTLGNEELEAIVLRTYDRPVNGLEPVFYFREQLSLIY
jgi:hypothetical protein